MIVTTKYGFDLELQDGSFMGKQFAEYRCHQDEERESELIQSLVRPGDFCIDVGAHVGFFTCLMAEQGANVLAIEPNPHLFKLLTHNTKKYRFGVKRLEGAAGDYDGEVRFYMPSTFDDGWGSLAIADSDNGTIPVQEYRLEHLIGKRKPRLIKIDVEGYEWQVLKGLGETDLSVEYILVECTDRPERLKHSISSVARINEAMQGWLVKRFEKGKWSFVPEAYSTHDGSFLFVNPLLNPE